MCHATATDDLLRSSGKRGIGIFIEEKKNAETQMELLWIEENDLTSAFQVADKAKFGYGLAQKGPATALRFAVRFRKLDQMIQFAKEIGLEETAKLGRFKLSGVNPSFGIHGILLAILTQQKWTNVEVLFVGEQHAMFLAAGGIGMYGPMHYRFQGALRQLQFSALNSQAKEMTKRHRMANAASASAPSHQPGRAASRKQLYEGLYVQNPLQPLEVGSPAKKHDKRPPGGPTGNTAT